MGLETQMNGSRTEDKQNARGRRKRGWNERRNGRERFGEILNGELWH